MGDATKDDEQKVTALDIQNELLRIAEENDGVLRAADVVEAARKKGSILHGRFTWDDKVAAAKWRLDEARELIRGHVVVMDVGEDSFRVRPWVSLAPDRISPGGGYRPLVEVYKSESLTAQLMATVKAEFDAFRRRAETYEALAERLAPLFEVADQVFDAKEVVRKTASAKHRPPARSREVEAHASSM